MKGSKGPLLKSKDDLHDEETLRLKTLLQMNEVITNVYTLQGRLGKLCQYSYAESSGNFLQQWHSMARESVLHLLINYANMLTWYCSGIMRHHRYALIPVAWREFIKSGSSNRTFCL